jgi:predicted P-loop ATPase
MTDTSINGGPGNVISFSTVAKSQSGGEADWIALCQRGKDGKPLSNLANVMIALRHDAELCNVVALDEMLQRPFLMKALPGMHAGTFMPRPLTDQDVTRIQELIQRAGLKNVGKDVVHNAVDLRADECRFHPVRDYLHSIKWDGTERLASWLHVYLGAEQTPYTQGVGAMFLTSMVARVFEPGCKADYMMVWEGPQGAGKSRACAILGGQWFSDNLPDVTGGKDVSQHLPGKLLIEIAEMSAMSRAETNHLKAFVTRTVEQYRPSYGRKEVRQPRQCVFIGTTNKSAYLKDESGGRRFWPVKVGVIDTDALRKDRDQLFAEAVKLYQEGAQWHPDGDFERKHIHPEQDARFDVDPWEAPVREYLDEFHPELVYVPDLFPKALGLGVVHGRRADTNRLTAILERLGWSRRKKKDSKGNYPWEPPPPPING